jgi:hypothetical protein
MEKVRSEELSKEYFVPLAVRSHELRTPNHTSTSLSVTFCNKLQTQNSKLETPNYS